MIVNWRADWEQGDFPFGFVQLAPFHYHWRSPIYWAELCEAQLLTLKRSASTGMVVTTDLAQNRMSRPSDRWLRGYARVQQPPTAKLWQLI